MVPLYYPKSASLFVESDLLKHTYFKTKAFVHGLCTRVFLCCSLSTSVTTSSLEHSFVSANQVTLRLRVFREPVQNNDNANVTFTIARYLLSRAPNCIGAIHGSLIQAGKEFAGPPLRRGTSTGLQAAALRWPGRGILLLLS